MKFKSQHASQQNSNGRAYYPRLDQRSIASRSATMSSKVTDLDSLWMEGFLHHEEIEIEKKIAKVNGSEVLSTTSTPNDSEQIVKRASTKHNESYKFSAEDQRGLMEAQKRLRKKPNTRTRRQRPAAKKSPYLPKNSIAPGRGKRQIRSKLIEAYFQTNRNEVEASITVQLMWRSIIAKRRLHNLALQRLAATTIQAATRGSKARSWVKLWGLKRAYYIARCQARLRQKIATRLWKKVLASMNESATFIQKRIRRYLARCMSENMKRDRAAALIQLFYKDIKRCRAHRHLKNKQCAVLIQKEVRRSFAQKYVRRLSEELRVASIHIQSCWRGYLARARRSKILVQKCSIDARDRILMLNSELSHYKDKLEQLLVKTRNHELLQQINKLKDKIAETRLNLRNSETNVSELQRMKAQMTPTSVVEGWEEQVNQSLQSERKMKTTMKLDLVLKIGKELKASERLLKESRTSQKVLEDKILELQKNRETFMGRLHKGEQSRSKREAALKFRKSIADEKRHWKFQHRTPSGKPMKTSTSAVLSSQFCSGSVNIFANEDDYEDPKDKLINMIALQSYMTQLNHFKGMLTK